MDTLLYTKWVTNKDLLWSTGNSAQCYVAACLGGGVSGRMDTRVCLAESLGCSLETITTLLIGHPPIENKKFKKINKKYHLLYKRV